MTGKALRGISRRRLELARVSERQRLAFSGKLSWVSTPLMLAGSLVKLVQATGFLSPFFGLPGMALVAKWPVALLHWGGKGLWIWKALASRGPQR